MCEKFQAVRDRMSVPTSVTLSDLEQRNYAVQVVTDVGANREPVCDFRLVITTN